MLETERVGMQGWLSQGARAMTLDKVFNVSNPCFSPSHKLSLKPVLIHETVLRLLLQNTGFMEHRFSSCGSITDMASLKPC